MDPLAPLITALHSEGRLRVWSLVITVFGDLILHRGGEVSTARLGQLLGRIGVEQGTLRTALSRLSSDGWVTSERVGRTSLYRLSAQGLAHFAPATPRIYAAPRSGVVTEWAMTVQLDEKGIPNVVVCPAVDAPKEADCQVIGGLQMVSDAYRQSVLPPAHRAALGALRHDLMALEAEISDPLDAAAARMLLIHRWRRIVLRFPEIVPDLMPDDAPLRDPRMAVAQIYAGLNQKAEAWLDSAAADLRAMPKAATDVTERFTSAHRA